MPTTLSKHQNICTPFDFFVRKQQITFIRNNNQLKHANTRLIAHLAFK